MISAASDRFLEQIVDCLTHLRGNALDLIYTNILEKVLNVSDIGNLGNCDHSILKIEVDISLQFNTTRELVRDWRKGDQEGLVNCIRNIDFPQIFQGKDVNEQWAALREMTELALDRYIPLTIHRKPGQPPWLTQAIIRITQKKSRYWKRSKKIGMRQILLITKISKLSVSELFH